MLCKNCGGRNRDDEIFCRSCLQRLTPGAISAEPESGGASAYAGFWERFAALVVDNIVICALMVPLAFVVGFAAGFAGIDDAGKLTGFIYLVALLMPAAYFVLMESGERGATLGKRWLRLRVVDTDGLGIGTGRALWRYVAHALSSVTLLIGYLIQPFTANKQALHDMVSGTVVVKTDHRSNVLAIVIALVVVFGGMVALVGILAAVAVPAYQGYVVKAKVNGAVQIGTTAARAVDHYYAQTGRFPLSIAETGVSQQTPPYVSGIEIDSRTGVVLVRFGGSLPQSIAGKALTFEPSSAAGGQTTWKCWGDGIPSNLLPQACR